MGGIVKWSDLRKQIISHLKNDSMAYTTMLIDYYGLYSKYQFPGWDESITIVNKNDRMDFLENAMLANIDDGIRNRFLPYLQLHEFKDFYLPILISSLNRFPAMI